MDIAIPTRDILTADSFTQLASTFRKAELQSLFLRALIARTTNTHLSTRNNQRFCNKITAWAAIPSSRPVKPNFSVVVAFTLTCDSSPSNN